MVPLIWNDNIMSIIALSIPNRAISLVQLTFDFVKWYSNMHSSVKSTQPEAKMFIVISVWMKPAIAFCISINEKLFWDIQNISLSFIAQLYNDGIDWIR